MTSREDLIETAARQIWDEDEAEYWGDDPSRRPFDPGSDDEDGEHAKEWLETVTRVADKLLPLITTVEQLKVLPARTWLIGSLLHGTPVLLLRSSMDGKHLDRYLDAYGPLTVWRP